MAINRKKGFALLVAVIFVTVMLAFGTALGALGYKQQILASNATRSQYAFYAADAALECALVDTQKSLSSDPYSYNNYGKQTFILPHSNLPSCGFTYDFPGYFTEICYNQAGTCPLQRVSSMKFPIADDTLCAIVTVYETNNKAPNSTYVYSQGFDVPCQSVIDFLAGDTTKRIVTQGISTHF